MVKCSKSQIRKLKTALRWKLPAAQRQRVQMVLLRESGTTQPAIAAAMGVSLSTVNRAHMAYDDGGIKALKPKPIGGRQRENMTLAGEKALLACFAKAAGAGEMLNIHDDVPRWAAHRGTGPPSSRKLPVRALDNALAKVGCPDRRIDRLCITCCSPFPTVTSRRMPDAISFTPRVRRVACSARPWSSLPMPFGPSCWRARWQRPLWAG